MSSSNVIKTRQPGRGSVAEYSYEALQGGTRSASPLSQAQFVPLAGDKQRPVEQPADNSNPADPEASIRVEAILNEGAVKAIPEEELDRQLLEAFEKGVQEGRRQAEKGLTNVFKALRDAVANVSTLWDKIVRDSEDDLLKLTMMVAKKVIQQEMIQDRRILANLVTAAVNSTAERDEVVIRLNPEDYKVINDNKQIFLAAVSGEKQMVLKPDESILPGGCIVDTTVGAIDARVDAQLDEIYQRLREEKPVFAEPSINLGKEVEQYARAEN